MKEFLLTIIFVGLIIVGVIFAVNQLEKSTSEKEYKMVKKGEVEKVEYISESGSLLSGGLTYTAFYFVDGAVVNICGRHDVLDKSCIEVYKVQNKVCWYDKINTCDPSSL